MNKLVSDINKAYVLSFAETTAVSAGDIRTKGSFTYLVLTDAAANVQHSGVYRAEKVELDATAANTFQVGSKVYWNSSTNRATSSDTGHEQIGSALQVKTAGTDTVLVAFEGYDRT